MKKLSILMVSLFYAFTMPVQAGSACHSSIAMLQCGQGTVDSVDYLGMVDIDGTTVLGAFNVTGNVDVVDAHLSTVNVKGGAHIAKTTIADAVTIQGNLHTNDTELHGPLKLEGNVFANNLTVSSSVNVLGVMYCESCVFQRDVVVTGNVTATNAEFLGQLTLNVKKGEFIHSRLTDIHVKKSSDNEPEVIRFKNGASVRNITFESQKGIVVLEGGAKVSGTVQGGKIETQKA